MKLIYTFVDFQILRKFLLSILFILPVYSFAQNCTVNANVDRSLCPGGQLVLPPDQFYLLGTANADVGFDYLQDPVWSQISGSAVNITIPTLVQTLVTGAVPGNTYGFRLTAQCADGSTVFDDVYITVLPITISNADTDQTYCQGTYALNGNVPGASETGTWSVVGSNNAGITINNPNSPNTTITVSGTTSGTTTLRWTIENSASNCESFDEIVITTLGGVEPVTVGADITLSNCYSATQNVNLNGSFGGNTAGEQQGVWTVVSGPNVPNFSDVNDNNTNVSGLVEGTYVFRWTVAGTCANGFDEVTVTVPPPTADVTNVGDADLYYCDGRTSTVLQGTVPLYVNESVQWIQTGGPAATIESPNSPSTVVSGMNTIGTYTFIYTLTNSTTNCVSTGTHKVVLENLISISAGPDQALDCGVSEAIIPVTSTGSGQMSWQIVDGPAINPILNPPYPSFPTPLVNFSGNSFIVHQLTFSGTYIVRVIKNPDPGSHCETVYDDVAIVVSAQPSGSNAGTTQILACNLTSAVLAGNIPTRGRGKWSQVSGPSAAVFSDITDPTTTVSSLVNGRYEFRWTISGGSACEVTQSISEVVVSSVTPTPANAGNDQSVCYGTPVQLQGNAVVNSETGTWTVSPNTGVTFSDVNDPNTIASGLAQNTVYTFTWTIENGCGTSSDMVDVNTNNSQGATADAGPDQCAAAGTTSITLAANDPAPGTGMWTQTSGAAATITTPSQYNTTITGLSDGDYEFKWTVSNVGCTDADDTVAITIAPDVTIAQAGNDQNVCGDSVTVTGNTPAVGETGLWEFVSGGDGPVITSPTSPTTTITGLTAGSWVYKWTISRGVCAASSDTVQLNINEAPSTAIAGPDQTVCDVNSVTLAATPPAVGNGRWTLISGPNSPVFSDVRSATSTLSNLITGEYNLEWTTYNGIYCPESKDQVTIKITEVAAAGSDYSTCLEGPLYLTGNDGSTGTWSYVSGGSTPPTITPTGSNSAAVTGLTPDTYVFRYTIAAEGACPETSDDISVDVNGQITTTPNAGPDQILCDVTSVFGVLGIQLSASPLDPGTTGKWTVLAGPTGGSFVNDTNPNTIFANPGYGIYVFNWTVSSGTCNSSDQVRIENAQPPSAAVAEGDNAICGSTTELTATPPTVGTGKWELVSGPTPVTFSSQIMPVTTVSGLTQTGGIYIFSWTVSNGSVCTPTTDTVQITVTADLTTPDAGPDQTICVSGSANLAANNITVGTGAWSKFSGPVGGTFSNTASPTSTFTPVLAGTYVLRWTATNLSCTFFDDMTLTVDPLPTTSNAGTPLSVCQFEAVTLNANTPTTGTGLWTQVSGPTTAVFTDAASPTTSVLGTQSGMYTFRWTISSGTCPSSSSDVTVTINELPPLADAGADQTICNTSSATLNGNDPLTATGTWTFVLNPGNTAVITNPNAFNSTVTNISVGTTRLKWTISNGSCAPYSDEVNIEKASDLITSDLTNDSTICEGGTLTLNTTPSGSLTPYSYQWQSSANGISGWSDISGQTNASYTTDSSLTSGEYYYRVNVSNSCTQITSNVAKLTIIPDPVVTSQPAGNTICSGATHTMSVVATTTNILAGTLAYQWQSSTDGSSGWANVSGGTGATTDTYTTATLTSNLYFRVRISQSGSGCETFSDPALVSVTTITAQPATPAPVCVGGTVNISIIASLNGGSGTLSYQWQSDSGSGFVDETNPTATTANFTSDVLTADTNFRCVVTSSETNCTLTSNSVTADVVSDPVITVEPTGGIICTGGTYNLSVTATGGTPGLDYQWYSSSDNISFTLLSGANSSTYTTPVLTNDTYYRVEVSATGNGCGLATSASVLTDVIPDPLITQQPVGNTICSGGTHTMNVVASGDVSGGALAYQWESSTDGSSGWANVSGGTGATTDTYTTTALTSNLYYRVRITQALNGCETYSDAVPVFVTTITAQPVTPADICVGGVVSLSISASLNGGAGVLSYQWQSDSGSGFTDETNPTATTANFTSDALTVNTNFRVIVTSSATSCTLTSNEVTATVVPDPTINTQPLGGTICTGGDFTLSVQASNGTPSLTYQWQSSTTSGAGFTDISGATNSTLDITNLTQTTYYQVLVSASGNGCTTITSAEVEVTVIPDPIITTQPVGNTTICKNGTATLSVAASGGSGSFSYQWQSAPTLGGTYADISGATSDTYTTSNLSATSYFRVVIANSGSGCDDIISNIATVYIGDINVQPVAPDPICSGGTATVSLTASANGGTATFAYQWESSTDGVNGWTAIGSANSDSYTTPALTATTYYRAIVTSLTPTCSLTSDVVAVTVIPDPSITTQPADGSVCQGGTYDLSVIASNGTPSLTYQWQSASTLGGTYTDISGAVSANYTTPALTATTYYRVQVSASGNGCTTVISDPATVTVVDDPIIATQPQDGAICVGNNYAFSVAASGDSSLGAVQYQWQTATVITGLFANVTDGTGGTTANYTTPVFNTTTTRYYRVVISQGTSGCETLSNTVTLTISAQPAKPVGTVTQQPDCSIATGTIIITSPAEGTGFEYSINGGTSYQASSTFSGLTDGVKTITVRKIGASTCVSQGTNFTVNKRICANPEVYASINGATGGNTTTVLGSDTLNGNPASLLTVNITVNFASSPQINLNPATGLITIAPGTPAGTYTVNYTICEKANLSNCSSTTETVQVTQSLIDAVADVVTPNVNGFIGRPLAINALTNDKLNGNAVLASQVTITVVTPAVSIGSAPVPTLNTTTGTVSVPAGTPESTYTIEYQICEKLNPANCDIATIVIPVVAPNIDAVDDSASPVSGVDGNPNVMTVLSNDSLNGATFTISQINLTQIAGATPKTPGALVPVLDVANGIVSVPAGTPSGTYSINYQICEKLNPSNCDNAFATVTVIAAPLIANDDNAGPINGYVGNSNVGNAYYSNDTFNGKVVDLAFVTPTILNTAVPVTPGALVPVLDVNTGIVSVPAGTPADDYSIEYLLTENLNPDNQDVALITIRVAPAPIIADDDVSSSINGKTGALSALNAYSNDSLNGASLILSEITRTVVTPASPILGGPVPALNTVTGNVSVPANTPAGVYTITYKICENLNPDNCDQATITVNVTGASIVANDDTISGINGYTGSANALDVIPNDTLNGTLVTLSEINMTVVTPAVSINGGAVPTLNTTTGLISIPTGTTAGNYTIVYRICEKLNPTNCDTATASITVNPPIIDAVNDAVTNVNGLLGQANAVAALANDTLNGTLVNPSEITLSVVVPAVSLGGNVPILNITTGQVNVPPGTTEGTYTIVYRICENLNSGNCDIATIKVGVGASTIVANNDEATNINGYVGANAVVNALTNDEITGFPASLTTVNLTVITSATAIGTGNIPELDIATGLVNVPAGTSAGTYSIVYQICEKLNPTVCDQATISITVVAPVIVANDDTISGIDGYTGQSNILSALTNDTLNNSAVNISEIQTQVITPANSINEGAVPFLDTVTGQVNVPAGTSAGNYFIDYRICEILNLANCNDARITISVGATSIVANDDTVNNINGFTGADDVLDVMTNDLLNGQPAVLSETVISIVQPAVSINGGLVPTLNTATGKVTVSAGTPAGVYTIDYQLCEQLNSANCDNATITITVDAPAIVANDDLVTNINGMTGANNVLDVLPNDTLNGQPVQLFNVNLSIVQPATPISGGLVPVLNTNTGRINVPAGTPAGSYLIEYSICDKLNPANCDNANVAITVIAPIITANDDSVLNVNGYTGASNVINAINNDLLNALPAKALDVQISILTSPIPINGGPVPVLNTLTGNLDVPAQTPAGTYEIGYQICDKLNPSNCDNAKITITVAAPVIDAVNDSVTGINGYAGASNILNAGQNDMLNGTNVVAAEVNMSIVTPAVSLGGAVPVLDTATGFVSVPAGTTAGTYTIVYRICETLNASNCDDATITITVNPAVVEAQDDFVSNINGLTGASNVINAINNDNLNGSPVQLAEIQITEVTPATSLGGPVPVLDTATGQVNVPANTPVGSYTITYRICEILNSANCDDAIITIDVTAAQIVANDDTVSGIDGFTGASDVLDAITNDTLNGTAVSLSDITISVLNPAVPISGGQIPYLDIATGMVSVPAGTTAGGYTIVYQICENLNSANCDSASIKVNVGASTIIANNDAVGGINGYIGAVDALDVIANDEVGGFPAELKDISISVVMPAVSVGGVPVPVLNTTTGLISIPAGTPAKKYFITYRICEILNSASCDIATAVIDVLPPPIVANDDNRILPVNGKTGLANVLNAFDNDALNGAGLILSEVNVSIINSPSPIPGVGIPAFDSTTGIVSVPAGTPAGLYTFRYQICEKLNPSNCDDALITVRVMAAPIEANDNLVTGINGFTGAANVVNVITNDNLNLSPVVLGDITISVVQPAIAINGGQIPVLDSAKGQVSVPAGTAKGVYTIEYQICEKLNPANCDTAIAYISVTSPAIVANNDAITGVNGFVGANNVLNAITNDRLNGAVINLSQITINVTQTATAINGGQVPVLNTTTGLVSVPAGTSAGNYLINYQICEVLNPANCDNASIAVIVVPPVIDAVNDTPAIVNGTNNNPNIINVLSNDRLHASTVSISQINLSLINPAIPLTAGALVPTLDLSSGSVSVPAGTPAGAYTIEYQICEKQNPANCDIATVLVQVAAAPIIANDDFLGPINGYEGNLNVANAFLRNDTFNGATVTNALVKAVIINPASPRFPGANVPLLDAATGIVSVPAGTPVGTYTIGYQLCERLNPTNCYNAIVRIQVTAAPIEANDEMVTGIDGYSGNTSVINAYANDTFNGVALVLSKIETTIIKPALSATDSPVPVFNPNTGNVSVPANTPAGAYTIVYEICEKLNPTNCDQATILVQVSLPVIDAVDDVSASVNGKTGTANALNAYTNDTLKGSALVLSQITRTIVSGAVPISGGPVPSLNLATGIVSVPANTPAATYIITYKICETLNPANCDQATITIPVIVSAIVANDDAVSGINGYVGGVDVLDAIGNDTLNGNPALLAEINTTVTSFATPINGGLVPILNTTTGLVSIPAGTTAGVYSIGYRICEKLNPTNCDDGVITVTVEAPVIVANDDILTNVNGYVATPNAIDVLLNDRLNGAVTDLTKVDITVDTPASPINAGPVPVLQPLTGIVSIPAGTPAGTYTIEYHICEEINPLNCDNAVATIIVVGATIDAVDDSVSNINGFTGAVNVVNALTNDILNGVAVISSQVTIGNIVPAISINGGAILVLDAATGNVSVPAGTAEGAYTIGYRLSENLNLTNFDTAVITINVIAPGIIANNDSASNINGFVGASNVVNAITNDRLNGLDIDLAAIDITSISTATPVDYVAGNPVPVLNETNGSVDVSAGTSEGTYTIHYRICEKLNPSNCSEADIVITVLATGIVANDDFAQDINGYRGGNNVVNALTNDQLNGVSVSLLQVNIRHIGTIVPLTSINGNIPVLNTITGNVDVPLLTSSGTYIIQYEICEKLNPANCSTASIYVVVDQPQIVAEDDTITNIDGYLGAPNVLNAMTSNDRYDGSPLSDLDLVLRTVISPATPINGGFVPFLIPATGLVSIPERTPAGVYQIRYALCDRLNPLNCDEAVITILVIEPPIIANDDFVDNINGNTGVNNVLNAYDNDILDGNPVNFSNFSGTLLTPATSINGAPVPVLNVLTGNVDVPPGTHAGDYFIGYKICGKLNPLNCDEAVIRIRVVPAAIDAVDDNASGINGFTGTTNALNALDNDTLNGILVNPADVLITNVLPATPINGGTVPVLDAATGIVNVPAGTTAGIYTITYTLREATTLLNSDTAIITIVVDTPAIEANDDTLTNINGYVATNNALDVLTNDTLNGALTTLNNVTVSVDVPAAPINGGPVPVLEPLTGKVSILAGTPAGNYEIKYHICEKLNPANCNDATVYITVISPLILAVDDNAANINGYTGAANVVNAITNDLLNGAAAQLSQINISSITTTTPANYVSGNPVPVLNITNGRVDVPAGTSGGTYTIHYSICEKLNPANCSEADIVIQVNAAQIVANNDIDLNVNGYTGSVNALNVLSNDSFDDSSITSKKAKVAINISQITITVLDPADPVNGSPNVPVLDVATGIVSVPPQTPAGIYRIQYRITENLNPSNFDDAMVFITVTATAIEANNDTVLNINGFEGQANVINAITNDNLNGVAAQLAEITMNVVTPATPINAGPVPTLNTVNGSVSVPAGTPSGTYTIRYEICEILNPTNCSQADIIVTVVSGSIIANDDSATGINGLDGAVNVANVLTNDLLDNATPALSQITISVLSPADAISGGAVPVLNTATGLVNVPAGTSSGIYTIVYQICENLNATNCDQAVIKITVVQLSVTLIKQGVFSDTNGDGYAQPGELIRYSFRITNTGTINLNNVTVTDPKATISGSPITLAVGQVNVTAYTGTYILTQADINLGFVVNQALVTAQPVTGSTIQDLSDSNDPTLIGDNDPTVTPVTQFKELTLIKGGQLTGSGGVGSVINYNFTVRNTGNVILTNVEITDPMLSSSSITVTPSTLAPGATGTATASYTVTVADVANGEVINTALAIGDDPQGDPVTDVSDSTDPTLPGDDDPTVIDLTLQPSIAVIKTALFNDENKNGYAEIGETVTYSFTVTNTGNVVLVNVVVKDPKPGMKITGGPIILKQGETNTTAFTGTYVLTAADIELGKVENQAVAESVSPDGVMATDLSDDNSNLEDDPTVLPLNACLVTIHNAVSPNGDGKNEVFKIDGIECYPNAYVQIYDRWGVLVYDAYGYDNDAVAFRGISEGRATVAKQKGLPDGTYFYVITYTTYLNEPVSKTGYLYLSGNN
ncbi:PKD domain-containing protein [Flavobacterium ajazii]|uniref:PKD domain-containing protein n=1 Tax=Flavobacterium ajazii TaxID=2692318 RepID=UPI0013CF5AB9|nr:gliding motility-associated C-terminal domain-containing protein [Flavobacterium ajazii]